MSEGGASRLAALAAAARVGDGGVERLTAMVDALDEVEGFLGLFLREDPVTDVDVCLTAAAVGRLDPDALARLLGAELAPLEAGPGGPGLPRQLTLDASLAGPGGGRVVTVLLWDGEERAAEAEAPALLGGALLEAGAPLLDDPALFAHLEVLQLAFSRTRAQQRVRDYRSGLELLAALQPPLRAGERTMVARALGQFREVLPFDVAALAVRAEAGPIEAQYLVAPSCPPMLVQAVKAELREALALDPGERLDEHYHNQVDGQPASGGKQAASMVVLPLVAGGRDQGRVGFFSGRPGFFTSHHLRLLGQLAPTLGAALVSTRGAERLHEKNDALESEQARVAAQLALARRIQVQLVRPCPPPPAPFEVASGNEMTAALGGDFYAARAIGKKRYAFAVADVAGKGLPAGVLMAHTRGALLAAWDVNPEPAHVLSRMNRVVLDSTDDYSFVTMMTVLVDARKGTVQFAGAGHEPILRRHPDGALDELACGDPPLGILPGHAFTAREDRFEAGDLLAVLTDGFQDALGPGGERWGRDRMKHCLSSGPGGAPAAVDHLMAAVKRWRGEAAVADDLTCVLLGRTAG